MKQTSAEKIFGEDRATLESIPVGKPLIHCAAELNTSHVLLQAIIYTAILECGRSQVVWDDLRPDVEMKALKIWSEPTEDDIKQIRDQFSPNNSYRDFLVWNGQKLTDLAKDMLEPDKFVDSARTANTDELLLDAILYVAHRNVGGYDFDERPVAGMEFEAMRIHSDPDGTDLDGIYTYFETEKIEGFEDLHWNEESLGEIYGRIKNRERFLEIMEKLSIRLDQLELTPDTRKCLEWHDMENVGDLVRKSPEEILAIPGMGHQSYQEIRNNLALMNLWLGMDLGNRQETNSIDPKEQEAVDLLMTRIGDLNLSAETVKRLGRIKDHNFIYLGDVLRKTEHDLLRLPCIGRRSLNDIKNNVLAGTDLRFGMEFDEDLLFGPAPKSPKSPKSPKASNAPNAPNAPKDDSGFDLDSEFDPGQF